ncbi:hypothetical protein MKW94_013634, partial [Papaver nudicaule]|nr:hypothetical protein [Papaver nudicaule]
GATPAEPPLNLGEFLVNANIQSNIAQKEKEAALKEEQSESQETTVPEVAATAPEVSTTSPPSEKVEKIEKEITLPSDKKENEVSSSTN